jgi:sigma-B regulation protein RsbU (phosphoserine phosphatase)
MDALIPDDEADRLAAVRRYDVLDTPPDGAFERITALAARHFGVPISIVSIVDTDRIWFKSHHGVDVDEIGRDPGLCASAILQDGPWVVENAATDPRTLANPLVAGELGLRFYAGAPLRTRDGFNLGTLCVIDQKPRDFTEEQAGTLADMAAVVMDELELRLAAREAVGHELKLREQAERMAQALQESLLPRELPRVAGAELAALYTPADAGIVGGDFYDVFETADGWALVVGDVSGKGASAAAVTALARHTIRSASLSATTPGNVLDLLNRTMFITREEDTVEHFCTVLVVFVRSSENGFSVTAASAGHPPALVIGPDGSWTELGAGGPPAGWYPEAVFDESFGELHGGNSLVLYTDGLSEARTADGLLGVEGLVRGIHAAGAHGAVEIVQALRSAITQAGTEVRDDAAALALSVRP